MKILSTFFFLVVFSQFTFADIYVQIQIKDKYDIARIEHLITEFDDVKKIRDGKYQYNTENNHITVICSPEQIGLIQLAGYRILSIQHHTRPINERSTSTLPYQFGWPRQVSTGWPIYKSSPTVADMNNDGKLEVSVTAGFSSTQPEMHVWRHTGAFLPGFPFLIPFGSLQSSGSMEISAMGDIDGDGQLEVVHADENGNIFAHKNNGTMLPGFPFNTGGVNEHSAPALKDLDGDGRDEIIITSWNRDTDLDAKLHVLKFTGTGVINFPNFPISYEKASESSPVVADIDNNGRYEIIVGTGWHNPTNYMARILCITDLGENKPGWPIMAGPYSVGGTPSLYDVTGDGKLEVVIRVKLQSDPNETNGIYAFDYLGNIVSPFPFALPSGHPFANVSIADMTGNGQPEFGFGTVQAVSLGQIFVFDRQGNVLNGFPKPVFATWVDGATAMGDMSGDGFPDIVGGSNQGKLFGFTRFGDSTAGFPLDPEATSLNGFNSSPTIADIDGDGDNELIAPCNDRKVYIWDTPGISDSVNIWSTFKGNSKRDGIGGGSRGPLNISNNPTIQPEDFILSQNYPNPFNPVTKINFSIPENSFVKLEIFDVAGRLVNIGVNEVLTSGSYEFIFNAGGLPSGVYYYKLSTENFTSVKKMILLK